MAGPIKRPLDQISEFELPPIKRIESDSRVLPSFAELIQSLPGNPIDSTYEGSAAQAQARSQLPDPFTKVPPAECSLQAPSQKNAVYGAFGPTAPMRHELGAADGQQAADAALAFSPMHDAHEGIDTLTLEHFAAALKAKGFASKQVRELLILDTPGVTQSLMLEWIVSLRNMNFSAVAVFNVATRDDPDTSLQQFVNCSLELIKLGFMAKEIAEAISRTKSTQSLQLLLEYAPKLLEMKFERSDLVKILKNDGGGQALETIINHNAVLFGPVFDLIPFQVTEVCKKRDGYLALLSLLRDGPTLIETGYQASGLWQTPDVEALPALVKLGPALEEAGFKKSHIGKLICYKGAPETLQTILDKCGELLDKKKFDVDQVASMAMHDNGATSIEAVLRNYDALCAAKYDNSEITAMSRHADAEEVHKLVLERSPELVKMGFSRAQILELAGRRSAIGILSWLLEHGPELIEAKYVPKDIFSVANTRSGAHALAAVLECTGALEREDMHRKSIIAIARFEGSSSTLRTLVGGLPKLIEVGFSQDDVVTMSCHQNISESISVLADLSFALVSAGFTVEMLKPIVKGRDAHIRLALLAQHQAALQNQGHLPEELAIQASRSSPDFEKWMESQLSMPA